MIIGGSCWWKVNLAMVMLLTVMGSGAYVLVVATQLNATAKLRSEPLLTHEQCDAIIEAAEAVAKSRGGWMSHRHESYPTVDLSAFDIPYIAKFWNSSLESKVFRRLEHIYKVDVPWETHDKEEKYHFSERTSGKSIQEEDSISSSRNKSPLYLRDLFVVKYAMGGQRSLSLHKDGSHLSFNIALQSFDSDYKGGGTYVKAINRTIHIKKGDVLFHPSALYHKGVEITDGVRYILVGFVKMQGAPWWRLWGNLATTFHLDMITPTTTTTTPSSSGLVEKRVEEEFHVTLIGELTFLVHRALRELPTWVTYFLIGNILVIFILLVGIAWDYYQIYRIRSSVRRKKKAS